MSDSLPVTERLSHIVAAIDTLYDEIKNLSAAEIANRKGLVWILERGLEIIGEAAKHIPQDLREKTPHIPWSEMISTRNRVSHGYDSTDIMVLIEIYEDDLPKLRQDIFNLTASLKEPVL